MSIHTSLSPSDKMANGIRVISGLSQYSWRCHVGNPVVSVHAPLMTTNGAGGCWRVVPSQRGRLHPLPLLNPFWEERGHLKTNWTVYRCLAKSDPATPIWIHAGCSWKSCECILRDRQNLFFSFLPHAFTSRGKKKKIIQFDNSHLPDMSTQRVQHYCPAKSLKYTAISHTSLSCHSAATLWGSLNRSLLSVPCQPSLPHSLGLPWIQCSWAARNTAEWQFCLTCHVWRWQIWQHPFFSLICSRRAPLGWLVFLRPGSFLSFFTLKLMSL